MYRVCVCVFRLCVQTYFMFLGFGVSEMINISMLRLDHNNCQASVNSVVGGAPGL